MWIEFENSWLGDCIMVVNDLLLFRRTSGLIITGWEVTYCKIIKKIV